MAHQRISTTPRIVGRPLFGEKGSLDAAEAEKLKWEIQEALRALSAGGNQAQVDLQTVEDVVVALAGTSSLQDPPEAPLHPFLLSGA